MLEVRDGERLTSWLCYQDGATAGLVERCSKLIGDRAERRSVAESLAPAASIGIKTSQSSMASKGASSGSVRI